MLYPFQSLDGFAFILANDGRFLYISETVSIYLGLSQVRYCYSKIFDSAVCRLYISEPWAFTGKILLQQDIWLCCMTATGKRWYIFPYQKQYQINFGLGTYTHVFCYHNIIIRWKRSESAVWQQPMNDGRFWIENKIGKNGRSSKIVQTQLHSP